MKNKLLLIITASLMATVCVTLTGCKGEQNSTLPYISSKDEVYYATDDMPAQTQPTTADTKSKNSENQSKSVNPDADKLAENTTYPTVVATNRSSSNNINPNASSVAAGSSSKKSNAITLSSSSIDLKIGQSKTINVSVNLDETNTSSYYAETNNNNVSVSCSGAEITITGKKAGNSTVIVKSGNKSTSCNVIILGNKTSEQNKNITDDTEIDYKELCTDYYQAKVTSGVNIVFYNDGNGSVYSSSLKKEDDKTSSVEVTYSSLKDKKISINELVKTLCNQFQSDMNKNDDSEKFDIKNYKINCYSEKQNNGEYTIYFCYQRL